VADGIETPRPDVLECASYPNTTARVVAAERATRQNDGLHAISRLPTTRA
jgi:hypothetical protein